MHGTETMREARMNPTAVANAAPRRQVEVIDIGDGYGVLGVILEPALSVDSSGEEPALGIVLSVVGGRKSDLVPTVPVKLVLGELARVPVSKLREKLAAALKPEQAA